MLACVLPGHTVLVCIWCARCYCDGVASSAAMGYRLDCNIFLEKQNWKILGTQACVIRGGRLSHGWVKTTMKFLVGT